MPEYEVTYVGKFQVTKTVEAENEEDAAAEALSSYNRHWDQTEPVDYEVENVAVTEVRK